MTLTQLYYFLKTVETLNFHKAAEELMISQPSLSAAIQHLEAELGVKLFLRKGRKISLTRRGEYFKNEVSRSLSRLHLATQEIQNAGVLGPGFIDLGYIASLAWRYIPEKVNAFLQETGYERLRFSFHELGSRELIEGLKTYRHDIIFCNQEEKDETIEFIPAVVQPLVAIVPEDHPLAKKDSINIRELAPYPLITYLPQVTLYEKVRILSRTPVFKPSFVQTAKKRQKFNKDWRWLLPPPGECLPCSLGKRWKQWLPYLLKHALPG